MKVYASQNISHIITLFLTYLYQTLVNLWKLDSFCHPAAFVTLAILVVIFSITQQ